MNRRLRIVSVCFVIFSSFCQCRSKPDFNGQKIVFTPLNENSFVMDSLPGGTLLDLIAYSGGKKNTKDDIYYYQFIGVNKENGDTIRILSTIISVPDEKDPANKIYSPTSQYDPKKRILSTVYYPQDSSHRIAIDKSIDIFQRNYKTVFGVLHFDEIPW